MTDTFDSMSFTAAGIQFDWTLTVAGTTGTGQVESISGTVGGEAITGLSGYAYADNQVGGWNARPS